MIDLYHTMRGLYMEIRRQMRYVLSRIIEGGIRMKRWQKTVLTVAITAAAVAGVLAWMLSWDGRVVSHGKMPPLDVPATEGSYRAYLAQYGAVGTRSQVFPATENVTSDGELIFGQDEDGAYVETPAEGTVTWTVSVQTAGRYTLSFDYCPTAGNGGNIQRALYINGSIPYTEVATLVFPRFYGNATEIKQDIYGNDIRPLQKEQLQWTTAVCRDSDGYVTEPLTVYLREGQNTVALEALREPMSVRRLTIAPPQQAADYATVAAGYSAAGYIATAGQYRQIEGENALLKTSPTIYPLSDTSTCATEPYEPSVIKLNTIGGTRWSYSGDAIEWEFDVPQTGLYQIAVKARQNITAGLVSSRRILIDGKVPFAELEAFSFFYDADWQMVTLGTENTPYLFYLEAGRTHTLRMEVTTGDMGEVLGVVRDVLAELNTIYREIIMVTGTSPDTMRDYHFEEMLPQTLANMKAQSVRLEKLRQALESYTGQANGNAPILGTLIRQLEQMSREPDKIARNLSYYKTNIGSLGTWINDMSVLNLEIDYIAVYSPDMPLKSPSASFGASVLYQIRRFFDAFMMDYNAVGTTVETTEDNTIRVWSSAGRDQMQTLKVMLNDSFTQETGIGVKLELVEESALLPATLAGIGPDVALGVGQSLPVDYALRGAVVPLNGFATYSEVSRRFADTLKVPYTLNGQVYALPESVSVPVMFYRTDILKELEIKVPQTWNDVIALTTILSNNNMTFGLPYSTTADPGGGLSLFYSLLLQNGGQVYSDDHTSCTLDEDVAVKVFKTWTNFYLNYGQPLEINFINRFRTGETPIGIAAQSVYNSLIVSTPEIKGLWDFTVIPGFAGEDGSIDRSALVNSACCVILANSDKQEQAWQFIDWWTRADIQLRFGREMESVLGASARYPTANMEAYRSLPWTNAEWSVLSQSFDNGHCVPEVPGGYFTARHINNAFRSVVIRQTDVKDTLLDYVENIDHEITKKRREFGLPTAP